jgi:hypothetical protein
LEFIVCEAEFTYLAWGAYEENNMVAIDLDISG